MVDLDKSCTEEDSTYIFKIKLKNEIKFRAPQELRKPVSYQILRLIFDALCAREKKFK